MRRPPKEKNSAAVARSTSGATATESPNFLLISKIAPLPPSSPYTITMEGRVKPMASFNDERTEATSLAVGNDNDLLENLQMMEWATPHPIEKNPFDSDSPSSESGEKPSATAMATSAQASGSKGDAASTNAEISSAQKSASQTIHQRLSAIDLRYLANQNRLLLSYVLQNQNDEPESQQTATDGAQASDLE